MKYRYVFGRSTSPYYNLAMERILFEEVRTGETVLFLWQNDNTIVVGKNQDVESECRLEQFLADGGRVARRHSGGGAVYHDLGNLNYSLISRSDESGECSYREIVVEVLRRFGLQAEYNGRNDLLLEGRKFSGNAFYDNGNIRCQHGTLLVSSDIARMTEILTPDKEKLERNRVHSTASRVINLTEVLPGLTVRDLCETIIDATEAVCLKPYFVEKEIQYLESCYSDMRWIYGRNFG